MARLKQVILLAFLCAVIGSYGLYGMNEVEPPSPSAMATIMKSVGFSFVGMNYNLQTTFAEPKQLQTSAPTSNPQPTQPKLVVELLKRDIRFGLCKYSNAAAAEAALLELKRIAVIRCENVIINCALPDLNCQEKSLQILSRVVNMIDCWVLELFVHSRLKDQPQNNHLYRNICRSEAQDAFDQIDYKLPCFLNLSSETSISLSGFISSGIVLQRPISTLFLSDKDCKAISFLNQLPLKPNYSLIIQFLSSVGGVDFSFLQNPSTTCGKITIITRQQNKITLTGLTNAVDKHPTLTLQLSWPALKYLSEHNTSSINVHTINCQGVTPNSIRPLPSLQQEQEPRIFATVIVSQISTSMPCNSIDSHQGLYTPEVYAEHGIIVKSAKVQYMNERSDLYRTMDVFRSVGALEDVPEEIVADDITCCGDALSDPKWTLQEPVSISLNHDELAPCLKEYQSRYVCFCQNIHYTTLEIKGIKDPAQKLVKRCLDLLVLFQNITANELWISDIRDKNRTNTNFDLRRLKETAAKRPQYKLHVKALWLDNVDDQILYWIFGHYIFTQEMDVYILNNALKNLAIAQLLSQPIGQNIDNLLLIDFTELDEVVHFRQQAQLKTFSLFKYVEAAKQEGKTPQTLGLHKLHLFPQFDDPKPYSDVLSKLWEYGIHLSAVPFPEFITSPTTYTIHAKLMDQPDFKLYNVTLEALKADFIHHQANPTATDSDSLPRGSVNELDLQFSDTQMLTAEDLVTIIRWVAGRFKDITTLQLVNAKMTKKERAEFTARNYLIIDLDSLKSILLKSEVPNTPPIELLTRPYHFSLLAQYATLPQRISIAVSATTLLQLASNTAHFDSLIPPHSSPNSSIQRASRDIKKAQTNIMCPVCCKELYVPNLENGVDTTQPDPDNNFPVLCYLKCGKPICNLCVLGIADGDPIDSKVCPYCREPNMCDQLHQIISAPPSIFTIAQGSTTAPNTQHRWITSKIWHTGQIYLCISYKQQPNITTLQKEESTITANPIYLI
ncbi:hypothetical protein NEHOM01_1496 [Nematocida homosporus]|uniref:uncharacterized protein n=1 Tax=Nematocida homosporus TaxID=1912981 RepID=UPI00221FE33C|nr:uncharacterized protein NEHOM01_1496 [Nematocida homosporus]KAI5186484.1 hypothetical protein NEHOM01_1496 [Nematocida homosporus]